MSARATAACDGVEPARRVVWLEPKVTVEVQFNEMMQGRLRDAVLRDVRFTPNGDRRFPQRLEDADNNVDQCACHGRRQRSGTHNRER